MARLFKRNLVVFGPELVPKAANWDRVYSPVASERPLVRARWGEGLQEEYKPIVLGYVPSDKFEKELEATSSFWFVMKPTPKVQEDFQKRWKV